MPHPAPQPIEIRARDALRGTVTVPGDKSISHRSLMLAGLAVFYLSWLGPRKIGRELATLASLDLPKDYRARVWGDSTGNLYIAEPAPMNRVTRLTRLPAT